IASKIEQTHALAFQDANGRAFNVFADAARLEPFDPERPSRQQVELIGPAWMQYDKSPGDPTMAVPREFWMATRAWVSIDRASPSKPAMVTISLVGGIRFPREFFG